MSRCKTCKIKLPREGDDYCGHCWPAALEREQRKALAAAARQSGDVEQAPGEAPQSGLKGNAHD